MLPLEEPQATRAVDLADAQVQDLELDRQLEIDAWDLSIVSDLASPSLDGQVAFHVDGGHFPIQGSITYEGGVIGQVVLECG